MRPTFAPGGQLMALASGSTLGPYEIVAPLGAGGMGEVYRARDTRLDRTVAIKVLPPEVAANPDRRQRFEREARAISNLNHPHIRTLHDIVRAGQNDFLVMEYLEGETLAERLEKGPVAPGLEPSVPVPFVEAHVGLNRWRRKFCDQTSETSYPKGGETS